MHPCVYTEQLLLGELHPPYMALLIGGGATVRNVIAEGSDEVRQWNSETVGFGGRGAMTSVEQ